MFLYIWNKGSWRGTMGNWRRKGAGYSLMWPSLLPCGVSVGALFYSILLYGVAMVFSSITGISDLKVYPPNLKNMTVGLRESHFSPSLGFKAGWVFEIQYVIWSLRGLCLLRFLRRCSKSHCVSEKAQREDRREPTLHWTLTMLWVSYIYYFIQSSWESCEQELLLAYQFYRCGIKSPAD